VLFKLQASFLVFAGSVTNYVYTMMHFTAAGKGYCICMFEGNIWQIGKNEKFNLTKCSCPTIK